MRRPGAKTDAAGHAKGEITPYFEWALQDLNLATTDYEFALVDNASLRVPTTPHLNAPLPAREHP